MATVSGVLIVAAVVDYFHNLRNAELNKDLVRAVERGQIQRAEQDLKAGASPNTTYGKRDLWYALAVLAKYHGLPDPHSSTAVNGNPILTAALVNDDVKMTELLLRFGANANAPDYHGTLPLLDAIEAPHYRQLIPMLIDRHADPDRVDLESSAVQDTVSWAAEIDNNDAIRILLAHGAGKHIRRRPPHWGGEALFLTCGTDSNLASELVSRGAWVNYRDDRGATPLHNAVQYGNISLVQLLLRNGADAHAQDAKGNSPLTLAKDDPEMLEVLRSAADR